MKIALACSHGGHLTEMLYLMEVFEGHDVFFVTYESQRTKNLRYRKYLFPNFGERPLELLKNLPKIISIMLKEKPNVIVSNGAEIAIPFFYLGKLLRIKTIFIECYTRVNEPTITGKIVYPVSNLFLVLWSGMLKKYGKKAQYWGGLFEVSGLKKRIRDEKGDMIFVIVGMHYQGFERLVRKMDEIAGKIREKVVMQVGHTQCEPKNAEYFRFKDYQETKKLIKNARILVCQAAMTIIDSLMEGTPVIAVPRLKKFGEHMNDHQLIFAKKLKESGLISVIENIDELESAISNFKPVTTKTIVVNPELIKNLRQFIE